ncbi:SMP-30/gluconolactonase/LRE family protein [Pseudooceanicola algae]|uniref:6-deoxy-6-sulfogluconolactonase n=1 Tax=Pseudooceanicola algae TaxID=1537215 RepID=A0A418SFV8_9RHOB|nr:SMP-30/gluconolactonase/LRE family protein [Pseudooceanicola algae]QPM91543.1 6-deoxy-6-sulfogluconolactonase [Pseudooceanicola algae]
MTPQIGILANTRPTLGESPVWDAVTERLFWVDSLGRRIFRCSQRGDTLRAWDLEASVGSMALCEDGRAILAMRNGVHLFDFATGKAELIADPEPDFPGHTLNDGKVDRRGRFVFGSMNVEGSTPDAALYRMDRGRVETLRTGFTLSNGPCFSPDGASLYFADTTRPEILRFDYGEDDGALPAPHVLARLGAGQLDGATVDAEGCIWWVLTGIGQILRLSPEGEELLRLDMPVRHITSLTFGGPEMDILYVTSMGRPLSPDQPRDAVEGGAVFTITGLGITGLVEPRYRF